MSCATTKIAPRIYIHYQRPFLVVRISIYRKFHHIRTFKLTRLNSVPFSETAHIIPVFQILRIIETHFFISRNNHHPFIFRFISENFRVTEIFQTTRRAQDRIILIFRKGTTIVITVSQTLNLSVLIAGRSIESQNRACSITGHILLIDNGTPGEDMPQCVTGNGRSQMFPVHQVFADRMSPMHISPFGTVRVILIIQMIFSIFINQSVSIVHPTIEGSMVVNRTKLIRIGCIECIGQPDFFPAKCIF